MKKINLHLILILTLMFSLGKFSFAQLKLSSTGNIMIGSLNDPIEKLHVVGGKSVFTATTGIPQSAATIRGLNSYSTKTNPDYTWWNNDQTGLFHPSGGVIGFSSDGQERMRIKNACVEIYTSGNWGANYVIATHQNACGYVMKYGGGDNFYVHASGWIYSQGEYLGSDKKFKKEIVTIPNALNKVLQLRGVNYKLNYSDSMRVFNTNELHMGVVAQEVETIVPEVVKTMKDGTKAVAYQNLLGLLIEAIKEQQTQIGYLQEEIDNYLKNKSITESLKSVTTITEEINNPKENLLYQNTSNPFTENTIIKYNANANSRDVLLYIFDMQGVLLKTFSGLNKGLGEVEINGGELNAGMYFYSLVIDGIEIDTKRMILTR